MKVGLVTARFNLKMSEALSDGAHQFFLEQGLKTQDIYSVTVPGALEIPLAAKRLLENQDCAGVVVLGVIIRGETTHYDYVCRGVERGCTYLQMNLGKPIGSGVLTVENRQQAWARITGRKGNKGRQAAEALLSMLKTQSNLR